MSDIGINFPWWMAPLLWGLVFWPGVLVLALFSSVVGALTKGRWRIIAFLLTGVFAVELAFAGLFWLDRWRSDVEAEAYETRIHSVLDAARKIDGLDLPPGTAVTWVDPAHTHVRDASMDHPTTILGVSVNFVSQESDGWSVRLTTPQAIDGWICEVSLVQITTDGHLRRCTLSAGREWNGWPVPAGTLLDLARTDTTVGMVFPEATPVMAAEIGRTLPATGGMSMNADGSLDCVYFENDSPLVVQGVPLWNTVCWQYAPDTFGQGRNRPKLAVRGAVPSDVMHDGQRIPGGSDAIVRFADGQVTLR